MIKQDRDEQLSSTDLGSRQHPESRISSNALTLAFASLFC